MKNILVLYHGQSMYTRTVQDYVESFGKYSYHNVHYLHADQSTHPDFDFGKYDVLILTYACRLCYLENMSPVVRERIRQFPGLKVAFAQDEYQETDKLRAGIRELGIGLVFTCVPDDKIHWVYPSADLPGVKFVRVLTGYVPELYCHVPRHELPSLADRPNWIGYRGRSLGHCWGDLAHYKVEIGRRFKSACQAIGVPHDIAWNEESRIYQDKWFTFILSCRATLGIPSGLNVFDWDGKLEREYRKLIKDQPNLTYEEYRPRIAHKEREIDMGQISPRMFESVALGTALVLLEGSYSGVLQPGVHYIEIKKDFSNMADVLDQIGDVNHLTSMVDRAYENVIASRKWSYQAFVNLVDSSIDEALAKFPRPNGNLDGMRISPLKAFDQGVLEEYALKSVAQYPMSRCLDLSHLRHQEASHRKMTAGMQAWLTPNKPSILAFLNPSQDGVPGNPSQNVEASQDSGILAMHSQFAHRATLTFYSRGCIRRLSFGIGKCVKTAIKSSVKLVLFALLGRTGFERLKAYVRRPFKHRIKSLLIQLSGGG